MNGCTRFWLGLVLLSLISISSAAPTDTPGPYLATGIKVGEATQDSVIVWVRLTRNPDRVPNTAPIPGFSYVHVDDGRVIRNPTGRQRAVVRPRELPSREDVEQLQGAAPGREGQARVLYQRKGESAWQETPWLAVESARDFIRQFKLEGLEPGSDYRLRVETRAGEDAPLGQSMEGGFRTAPTPADPARVLFTVITCTQYTNRDLPEEGYKIYPQMLKLDPDFFVHTGDILYYDTRAKTYDLARWHWQAMYSLPTNVDFHRQVSSYFIKDDHDTWVNDCWPTMKSPYMGEFTFEQGLQIFRDEVPMGDLTYRTVRWGKDLQVWMVEGRDYRSPNDAPDGPDKTIWGGEQKAWLKRTMAESDAAFRILLSPTPLVGPDRGNKGDNHANPAYEHEGRELRQFLAGLGNAIVINGDRHWQYVSEDAETGLREYGCGPGSDEHAGGWNQDDVLPEHRYLNVVGGFLSVEVRRVDGKPTLTLNHHGVNGEILHCDVLPAKP